MQELEVDLVVIGAGPAGQKGAIQGAKAGKKVAVIDRLGLLGGASLHQGTIPSKALRSAILDLSGFMQSTYYGDRQRTMGEITMSDLTARIQKVIEDSCQQLDEQCASNDIEVVYGSARLQDPHVVEALDVEGKVKARIRADKILIATGSRPRHPIEIPPNRDLFLDSDQVFRMDRLPESLVVLGGGVIGCEYATMFAALGVEVTLVERRKSILRMLDSEIGSHFTDYIQEMNIRLMLGRGIDELRPDDKGQAQVVFSDGETLEADRLFYSMGRIGNLEGLGLEEIGVEIDSLGNISVNPLFQTSCANIYAAGDVIGPPGLASTSVEQGRLAIRNAFTLQSHHFPKFFPYGIYTVPEISSVGPTEDELREKGVNFEVGRAPYHEIARGPIASDTSGLIKLIFHAETLEVLAVHIIGTHATELISLGQMALDFRVRVDYFVDTIFNYPTFAEGFRIAALNGLNKLPDAEANWS
jgi:NAD(P) transhydrogenase